MRTWRWVTRDKNTNYDYDICIWPGVKKPDFIPNEDGEIDWWQRSNRFRGDSIDIPVPVFNKMFGFALKPGEIEKLKFKATYY